MHGLGWQGCGATLEQFARAFAWPARSPSATPSVSGVLLHRLLPPTAARLQSLTVLDALQELLTRHFGWSLNLQFLRLDGSKTPKARSHMITQFNKSDSSSRVRVALARGSACFVHCAWHAPDAGAAA